jgi:hypothetical protein
MVWHHPQLAPGAPPIPSAKSRPIGRDELRAGIAACLCARALFSHVAPCATPITRPSGSAPGIAFSSTARFALIHWASAIEMRRRPLRGRRLSLSCPSSINTLPVKNTSAVSIARNGGFGRHIAPPRLCRSSGLPARLGEDFRPRARRPAAARPHNQSFREPGSCERAWCVYFAAASTCLFNASRWAAISLGDPPPPS